jgi:hypothetical protein
MKKFELFINVMLMIFSLVSCSSNYDRPKHALEKTDKDFADENAKIFQRKLEYFDLKKSGEEIGKCASNNVYRLDDGISDAMTIAKALYSTCRDARYSDLQTPEDFLSIVISARKAKAAVASYSLEQLINKAIDVKKKIVISESSGQESSEFDKEMLQVIVKRINQFPNGESKLDEAVKLFINDVKEKSKILKENEVY